MKIGGIKKSSLLDFPNKISAIVFTQGCNFNCGYCHNPMLLNPQKAPFMQTEEFFEFLKKRKGKLEGVVISGGEPTIQHDLISFIKKIKDLNFLVKLDTNGSNPDILEVLIKENLIDYIAMDIKAPLKKYSNIVNVKINEEKIKKSILLILNNKIDYEFRTTFMPYYHKKEDFEETGKLIKGAKRYYLQKFEARSIINNPKLSEEKSFTETEINEIITILKKYVNKTEIR